MLFAALSHAQMAKRPEARQRIERYRNNCFRCCVLLFAFGQVFRTTGAQNIVSDLTTANGYEWRASLANGSERLNSTRYYSHFAIKARPHCMAALFLMSPSDAYISIVIAYPLFLFLPNAPGCYSSKALCKCVCVTMSANCCDRHHLYSPAFFFFLNFPNEVSPFRATFQATCTPIWSRPVS